METGESYEARLRWIAAGPPTTLRSVIQVACQENHDCRPTLCRLGVVPPMESISNTNDSMHFYDEFVMNVSLRDILKNTVTPGPLLPAKIIGLKEPLKVRTITAGPEEAYYVASFIQKFLHGHLRKNDTFRLIGKQLDLNDVERTFAKPLAPGQFLVSGDYKSATDLISAALSEACAREIGLVTGMPFEVVEMFVDCLVHHEIRLGKQAAPQQNGQLMGSPVSFPILCLINAALTRFSLELRGGLCRPLRLGSFPLLINGDDVGFVTDEEGYNIWKLVTRAGGLQFSVGKNFTSRKFLVINSCMFQVGPVVPVRPMRPSYPRVCYNDCHRLAPTGLSSCSFGASAKSANPWNQPCHGGCPFAGRTPDEKRLPEATEGRQTFFVSPYQNPDYLGPRGRWFADEGGDTQSLQKAWATMPGFQRLKIHSIGDLFEPEGYAVLPGLQKAWLGSERGPRRHQLNLVFLNSWRPVLDLSTFAVKSKRGQDMGHHTRVTPDWFLPVELGGLGLENTDRVGSFGWKPSGWSRQLAFYLLHRPWLAPMTLPGLKFTTEVDVRVVERLAAFKPKYVKDGYRPSSTEVDDGVLLARVQREEWIKTFQVELQMFDLGSLAEPGELGFSPRLGDRTCVDKQVLLKEALTTYRVSREKLYRPTTVRLEDGSEEVRMPQWQSGPKLSPKELAAFKPRQRLYDLSPVKNPVVQLGGERPFAPQVQMASRKAGWMRTVVPPEETLIERHFFDDAGIPGVEKKLTQTSPGEYTLPVFAPGAIEMLHRFPGPHGLRRSS